MQRFSDQLLQQQLMLFGEAALAPEGSPVRSNTFLDGALMPQIGRFVRKVGRPRHNWTSQLIQEGTTRFGYNRFSTLLQDGSQGAYIYIYIYVGRMKSLRVLLLASELAVL